MHLYLSILLFLFADSVSALQKIDANPEEVMNIKASMSDPNMISISGSAIDAVWGTEDKVSLEANVETGQAIFRPMTTRPFTLFVQSVAGLTYTLTVTPQENIMGQNIIIKETEQLDRTGLERSLNVVAYKKEVKRLLKQIELSPGIKRLKGFRVKVVNQQITLWAETKILHASSWVNGRMIIDRYIITNVSDAPLVMEEREFRNIESLVRAVAIKQHQLQPAQSTVMYTFRSGS